MRKEFRILLLLLLVFSFTAPAQIGPDTYFIQFSDKDGTPYTIDEPEAFLSQRAIDRRLAQGIAIIEQDLPVNPSYLDGVAALGPTMLFPSKWLNGLTIITPDQNVLNDILDLPYVVSIRSLSEGERPQSDETKIFFSQESISDDNRPLLKSEKAYTTLDYGNGYTQINQINGIPLHEAGYKGQGMVIALLDGGYSNTNTHAAFDSIWMNGQILGTKDFVEPGGNVFTQSSHGTAVLSTIASNVPGQLVGTAPKASFWLLRPEYVPTENLIEEYNWVSAAEFADSVGADIINSSLGYINFDMPEHNHSYDHMDGNTCIVTIGADIASSKGILVVNSAGNSGNNSQFPYMGAPADGFDVFSIGAVNDEGNRASFSSIGPTYDGRIKPDIMAMGQGTAVASGSSSNFSFGNGTSFSSPVIAGMSACLWQANPSFTNLEIKEAIMQSGSRHENPDVYYGHGIPDYALANSILTLLQYEKDPDGNLLRLGPNPFSHKLNITYIDSVVNKLNIHDISGKLLQSIEGRPLPRLEVEQYLQGLRPGIYLLHIVSPESKQTIKLVKIE